MSINDVWKSGWLGAALFAGTVVGASPQQVDGVTGIAFVPWTGDIVAEREALLTVQNATSQAQIFLLIEFPAEEGTGCTACRILNARCSPETLPGESWTATVPGRAAAVIGLGPDSRSNDLFCDEIRSHPGGECERYRSLLADVGVASLDPIAATARLTRRARLGRAAEDLVGALGPADIAPNAGVHAYVATGLHLDTLDGFDSTLAVQNAGTECVTATLELNLTGDGPAGGIESLQVPPGAARLFRPSLAWPYRDTGAVRISADGPLAVTVATVGYDTAAAHGAEPERPVEQWFAPLAFQEERRAVDPEVLPGFWPGGETMVGALNLTEAEVPLQVRTQAVGHQPRPIIIRLPGLEQTVFEFGFGLSLDGGPGWGRMVAPPGEVVFSLEHVRPDSGGVRFAEQYSQRAWARVPGEVPKTIALPDLGGPAVGPGMALIPQQPGAYTAMTDTLEARLAIANLLSEPAVVAIEGAAACGPTGAITRTVAADAAIVIPARELPGVANGGNRAVVHVIEGEAAASLDIVRTVRSPDGAEPPPDFTSGYKGLARTQPLALTAAPTARLSASAEEIVLHASAYTATLDVAYTADGPRCLGYTATTDAAWLSVTPAAGALPATLSLRAAGAIADVPLEAVVLIAANVDGVLDSPLSIRVRKEPDVPASIFLPRLGR